MVLLISIPAKPRRSTMMSLLLRVCFVFLVLNIVLKPTDAWARYGSRIRTDFGNEAMSKDVNRPKTFLATNSGLPSQNATSKGLGISAWGIVLLIVALILAGMGVYYFSICYTICKTDKSRYDKMGMPIAA